MTADNRTRNGFALIVVLSTLSIIALLVASSTTRLLSRMTEIGTEERIARTAQEGAALVRLALRIYGNGEGQVPPDTRITVPWLDGEAELFLQDVGGLVDLNTAGAELMEHLVRALNLPDEALDRFRRWRRTPHRLQSVSDFARVARVGWREAQRLDGIATVHSGRFGISPEHAPPNLVTLLSDSGGALHERWQSPPSGLVFDVRLIAEGQTRSLGTVALKADTAKGRILELR